MTFDEALKIYDDPDVEDLIETWEVVDVIEKLQKEYAPTVEMTAKEKEHILAIAATSIKFTNFYEQVIKQSTNIKFGVQTTPELYKHLSENELMQAWLYPETIKVVDE